MRLTAKLSLAIFACCALGMFVAGVLIIRREHEFADRETAQHGRLLGQAIASSIRKTWLRQGEDAVVDLIEEIDRHDPGIRVRWVELRRGTAALAPRPFVTPEIESQLLSGQIVGHINRHREDTLYTLVPIARNDGRVVRVVEIAESLEELDRHIHLLVISIVAAMAGALLVSGLAVVLLGRGMVGRPITALVAKARRVGQGDLLSPVTVSGRNELSDLAHELNAMAHRLAEARSKVEREAQSRRAAEDQLRHAERLATVGKLAAGVAHEMGTPLNVIAECARRIGVGDAEAPRLVETISRHAARITEIVKSLLRFARRKPLARNRLDLVEVLENTQPLLQSVTAKRAVEVVNRLEVSHAQVEGDEEQLEQVLTNLVVNAVQAMPNGGQITIGLCHQRRAPPGQDVPDRDFWCLWVEDQGSGIAPEALPHVFDPFFTTKEVGQGTGLGLSICFGIVKDHRGWIDVDSTVNQGSRFTVFLPAMPDSPADRLRREQPKGEVFHGTR